MDNTSSLILNCKKCIKNYARLPVPKHLNFLWTIGAMLLFLIAIMLATGLIMALTYTPQAHDAFSSIEEIERIVPNGWLVHSMHKIGATLLFACLYLHIFRGLFYRSYLPPHTSTWTSGCLLLFLCYLIAMSGYMLDWNQLSYWGSAIAGNMLATIPLIGDALQHIFLGGTAPGNATLHRMFVAHFTIAFLIAFLIGLHIASRHRGEKPLRPKKQAHGAKIPFYPFYVIKDLNAVIILCFVFTILIGFYPDFTSANGTYRPANPLHTPTYIAPPWYLLVPYSIMGAIPSKLGGLIGACAAILMIMCVPFLDSFSQEKYMTRHYRYLHQLLCLLMIGSAFIIAIAGAHHLQGYWCIVARIALVIYFSYFVIYLPLSYKIGRDISS